MEMSTSRYDDEAGEISLEAERDLERLMDRIIRESPRVILPDGLLRKIFTAAVRQYAARYESNPDLYLSPLLEQEVTASDVGTCCIEMLNAADMQLFELTMWGSRIPELPEGNVNA